MTGEEPSGAIAPPQGTRRYKVLACEILTRELYLLAANCPNIVDITLMPKALHDLPTDQMRTTLQQQIDEVDQDRYDAILLAYARCNDGVAGLQARQIPLVIPRAHDCITLFLGSRRAYSDYFDSHPGTYYYTTGWVERNQAGQSATVMHKLGLDKSYEQYAEQYGKENAEYIMQILGGWQQQYDRITYIDLPVGQSRPCKQLAENLARQRGWKFEVLKGSLILLEKLLAGQWDDDFLVVHPGQQIAPCNDHGILKACPVQRAVQAGEPCVHADACDHHADRQSSKSAARRPPCAGQ